MKLSNSDNQWDLSSIYPFAQSSSSLWKRIWILLWDSVPKLFPLRVHVYIYYYILYIYWMECLLQVWIKRSDVCFKKTCTFFNEFVSAQNRLTNMPKFRYFACSCSQKPLPTTMFSFQIADKASYQKVHRNRALLLYHWLLLFFSPMMVPGCALIRSFLTMVTKHVKYKLTGQVCFKLIYRDTRGREW